MSGSIIGGVVGAAIGFVVTGGNPAGAYWGWTAGSIAGALLFPEQIEGPRLQDLKAQSSEYGRPIPIVYGTIALGGNVIWASDLVEVASEEGGKGGPEVTNYSYYANFAVAICEGGENISLGRIWAGPEKRLIWDGATLEGEEAGAQIRFYNGSETQEPDPLIESYMGAGSVPAYRGTAYLVVEHFPVAKDGNRIPFLTIEVGNVETSAAPEDLGVVNIDQVLVFDNLYAVFYWGTYYGIVIRHQSDNTLYAHYVYDLGEWDPAHNSYWYDSANTQFVRHSDNVLSYATYALSNGDYALVSYSAAGSADSNPGTFVKGGCLHPNGSYIFAANGSSGAASRVTLYIVDPATGVCSATYCGDLPAGELLGPIRAPLTAGESFVYALTSSGGAERLYKLPLSSGFTPVDLGATAQGDNVVMELDPNTGSVWTVVVSTPGTVHVTAHDSSGSLYSQSIASNLTLGPTPLSFVPGSPNKTIVMGDVWLATDAFLQFNADTPALISAGDEVGGYYGTSAPHVLAYNPTTAGLMMFREDGWITFGETSDPASVNLLTPGTFEHEGDNKYLGEQDGTAQPQGQALSEIVADLSARAGLTAGQIDVTALTDTVDGYAIANQTDVKSAITALAPAFLFDGVESGGKVKYVKRGGAIAATIADDELGAYESGSQPVDPLETRRQMDEELPANMNVRFILEATNYDVDTRIAKRLVGNSGTEATIDLPIVMTEQKAQEVAEVNLHGPWVARLTYRFSLPRKYAYLEPTDVIAVGGYTVRIVSIKQTAGRYQVEAVHDDANVYVPNVVVTPTPPSPNEVETVSETLLELM